MSDSCYVVCKIYKNDKNVFTVYENDIKIQYRSKI